MTIRYGFYGAYCDKCGRRCDSTSAVCNCQWQEVQTVAKKQGWICPQCGAVWAWWKDGCHICNALATPRLMGNTMGTTETIEVS